MTPQQIQCVKSTWQQVLPIRAAAADIFYGRLFELAPEVRPLFKRDIHAQGAMLMATLGAVVDQLDRPTELLPSAEALARRHVGYGVRAEHYAVVGSALLWTLAQGLGTAFTPAVREAWSTAYHMLADAMQRAAYAPAERAETADTTDTAGGRAETNETQARQQRSLANTRAGHSPVPGDHQRA
jgi:nitric oxide dioxygenase